MSKIVALLLGGALGTAARYLVSESVYKSIGIAFPIGTMVVNVLGCFLIGWFSVLADKKLFHEPLGWLFLVVGFCGAFTTFSTFIFETANLLKAGESLRAFTNITVSVIIGFIALMGGVKLGQSM